MIIIREAKLTESTDISDLALGLYASIAKNTKRAIVEISKLNGGKGYDCKVQAENKGVRFYCDDANIFLVNDFISVALSDSTDGYVTKIESLKLSNRILTIELSHSRGWILIHLY